MGELLQVLHVVVFGFLAAVSYEHRKVALYLLFSGFFYLFCREFVFPLYKEYPNGVIIYLIKAAFDMFIVSRLRYTPTMFSAIQALILWLNVGWNVVAMIEFMLPYKVLYNSYGTGSHALNIAQLFVGVVYAMGSIGLGNLLRNIRSGMGTNRGSIVSKERKPK